MVNKEEHWLLNTKCIVLNNSNRIDIIGYMDFEGNYYNIDQIMNNKIFPLEKW